MKKYPIPLTAFLLPIAFLMLLMASLARGAQGDLVIITAGNGTTSANRTEAAALPVALGGTGGTNATQAWTNLGGVRSVATTAPLSGGGNLTANLTLSVGNATTSATGVVELATDAEVQTGTDTVRGIVPSALAAWWTWVKTQAQTLTGALTLNGTTTLNGNATFGAAANTAWVARQPLAGDVADSRYRQTSSDLLAFVFWHNGNGFALTTNGTMGSSTSYSTGVGTYASAAGSALGDFTTDSGSFGLGNGDGSVFDRQVNHVWSWQLGANTGGNGTSLVFSVGGSSTSLNGTATTVRSLGVTVTPEVVSGQTQYQLWLHNGSTLVGNSTVSTATPRVYSRTVQLSLVYQWNAGVPTLRLYGQAAGAAPSLITSLTGAGAVLGGDIPTRGFIVRHYVNTAAASSSFQMRNVRWQIPTESIP